jgi:vacuolar iron transporter family protein
MFRQLAIPHRTRGSRAKRKELSDNAAFELAEIYAMRGVDQGLAREVAQQLMAKDALTAHARDERATTRVTFWGALAMTLTAEIGKVSGTVV